MPTLFQQKAPKIMGDLMHDFGFTDFQAAGILGNIGVECGGFLKMQEVSPVSGVGGFGWAQWTGPRRRTFFTFCQDNELSVDSDDGNYAYLKHELKTTYASVVKHVLATKDINDATQSFETHYEAAGVPNMPARLRFAALALAAYRNTHATPPAPEPEEPKPPVKKTSCLRRVIHLFSR